jgi:hypothetical protein
MFNEWRDVERARERNSDLETIAGRILTMTRGSWRVMGASITRKTKIGGTKSGNGTQLSGRGRPGGWTYRQQGRHTASAKEIKMESAAVVLTQNKEKSRVGCYDLGPD